MEIVIASFVVSSMSLSGVIFFGKKGYIAGDHRFILPFAIGAFIAVIFFDLVPETLEGSAVFGPVVIVTGFLLFYLISNILHTYHHHHDEHGDGDDCGTTKVSALMLLWGDSIHNFTDGVVIATAFFISPVAGVVTTIAIALHEIPQEIAEYGVLRSAGYSSKKAVLLNFLSATGVIIGAVATILFEAYFAAYIWILIGLVAGNLLYVASSDLLPGVHRESQKDGSFLISFCATVFGVVVVGSMITFSTLYF